MQDRVGEILAQRRSLESGAGAAVVLSLLLHGAMTAAAIWAALHAPAPQTANILNIHFGSMTKPPVAHSKPVEAPVAAPKKIETPKITEPIAPVKPTAAKPEPKTVPLSNFGKSTRKGSEHPPAPPAPLTPAAAVPAHAGVGSVTTTGAEVTGLEGGDFPYTLYIENMKRLIGSRWFHPQVTGAGIATIYFVIERDGTIHEAKTETSSGNGTFDRAALRAVLESSPLPPLPFGYGGTFLGVHLTFK
jgi:protein TonB